MLAVVLGVPWLLCISLQTAPQTPSVQEILASFNGNWQGVFKVYSLDGRLQDEVQVEQRYWWKENEQQAVFIERKKDGTITLSKARNYVQDGQLLCEVINDRRGRTVHHGHYQDGLLFWHRRLDDPAIIESFKERVVKTSSGREYQIDGVGIYGSGPQANVLIFEARYQEVK